MVSRFFQAFALTFGLLFGSVCDAQTVDDLLPGIDAGKLFEVKAWWAANSGNVKGDGQTDASQSPAKSTPVPLSMAKLAWRVARLSDELLDARAQENQAVSDLLPLQVVKLSGKANRIRRVKLGDQMADLLEFESMWLIDVDLSEPSKAEGEANQDSDAQESPVSATVICRDIPNLWTKLPTLEQQISAAAIFVAGGNEERPLFVAPRLRWFPGRQATDNPKAKRGATVPAGWALLGEQGYNASMFDMIIGRNRKSLSSAESPAFYNMLRSASKLPTEGLPDPLAIGPQQMFDKLQSSFHVGEFIRLRMETARIQLVQDAKFTNLLGQDHYWEVDAFADLGNVRIELESESGPIKFGHRYPVTLTMLELPPFLKALVQRNGSIEKVMLMHKTMIEADGFFYRLWSYDTDFVGSRGGDRQIGPLVVAASVRPFDSPVSEVSVQAIGWIAATIFLLGLALVFVYAMVTGTRDKSARKVRQQTLPTDLSLDTVRDDSA